MIDAAGQVTLPPFVLPRARREGRERERSPGLPGREASPAPLGREVSPGRGRAASPFFGLRAENGITLNSPRQASPLRQMFAVQLPAAAGCASPPRQASPSRQVISSRIPVDGDMNPKSGSRVATPRGSHVGAPLGVQTGVPFGLTPANAVNGGGSLRVKLHSRSVEVPAGRQPRSVEVPAGRKPLLSVEVPPGGNFPGKPLLSVAVPPGMPSLSVPQQLGKLPSQTSRSRGARGNDVILDVLSQAQRDKVAEIKATLLDYMSKNGQQSQQVASESTRMLGYMTKTGVQIPRVETPREVVRGAREASPQRPASQRAASPVRQVLTPPATPLLSFRTAGGSIAFPGQTMPGGSVAFPSHALPGGSVAFPCQPSGAGPHYLKPPTHANGATNGSRNGASSPPGGALLKLAIFDFDCTLTVSHVFSSLSGNSATRTPIAAPHARSERGQLSRLLELEVDPAWGPSGFALAAFGQADRVRRLHCFLAEMRAAGVECIVCSRGMLAPLRKCLDQMKLLGFFSQTFGSQGAALGTTDYDRNLPPVGWLGADEKFVGSSGLGGPPSPSSKAEIVASLIQERGLAPEQAVLLDDDIEETKRLHGVCGTIHVNHEEGIGEPEFNLLRRMVTEKIDIFPRAPAGSRSFKHSMSNCSTSTEDRQAQLDRVYNGAVYAPVNALVASPVSQPVSLVQNRVVLQCDQVPQRGPRCQLSGVPPMIVR